MTVINLTNSKYVLCRFCMCSMNHKDILYFFRLKQNEIYTLRQKKTTKCVNLKPEKKLK